MKHNLVPKPLVAPDTAELSSEPTPQKEENVSRRAELPLSVKHILVPLDFSDCSLRALAYAVAVAGKFEARLTLLHVLEPVVVPDNYLAAAATFDEANQNPHETTRERLAAIARTQSTEGIATESLIRMGRAYSEIPDTAQALGVDMIILGTHGYTGLKHVLLGSTAERVVRHAACPVLTVRHAGA
jgi:nucleotide-binding universal stress UspA family protein